MSGIPGAYGHNEKETPRKSLLSDFTDAKSESKGQECTTGHEQEISLGVENKKRKGEGENGQMVESKKSKTGEDWDKPIVTSGSRDDSDSLASLREQKATLQDRKQKLRRETKALRQSIRDAITNSAGFKREIHDHAKEIVASKLVVSRVTRSALSIGHEKLLWTQAMYTEKLGLLSTPLSAPPSELSRTVDVLRAEKGGKRFGRIYDQMIKDRVEEVQKKIQKEIDEKETEKAFKAMAALDSDQWDQSWEVGGFVFPRWPAVKRTLLFEEQGECGEE